MSILDDKRPLSEDESSQLSNKRQKFEQAQESDIRSTSNHVSLPLSQVMDAPTTKPLDGPGKPEIFDHFPQHPPAPSEPQLDVKPEVSQPLPDEKPSVQYSQPPQQPTPAPSEPPQLPSEPLQAAPSVPEPPTPQPEAMATPAHVPSDTPQQFPGSDAPQPPVNGDSPAQPAVPAPEPAAQPEAPLPEPAETVPAVAAEGQLQPLSQPLAPPQPQVEQSEAPQPQLGEATVPPPADAVAQDPIEQTHQPVAAQSTEPQPQAMELGAQQAVQDQQPSFEQPVQQETAEEQAQQPSPAVETHPQPPQPFDAQGQPQLPPQPQPVDSQAPQTDFQSQQPQPDFTSHAISNGQPDEAPQQSDAVDQPAREPQPFDTPGVSIVDGPDGSENVTSAQPIVPPTPAGTEPIILPNGNKLPPRSAAYGIPAGPPFSFNQLKYVSQLVKQLKKMKAAVPFLSPVDYLALGVPHYPEVISEPSDLGTVDRKVQKTIKAEEGGYFNFNDWETDVRRIFRNTEWFNGFEHPVSKMGRQVEESFDKQLKKMPPSTSEAVPSTSRGRGAPRRSQETGRPRRDTQHPTAAQQHTDANRGRRRKTTAYGRNGTADQMRHCAFILKELHKKVHSSYASPFYDPVDYVAFGLPDYPQVIQHPMDLSTIGQKLNYGDYEGPNDFFSDMKLMFGNCYKYNPPGTPVHEAGRQTETVFDEKWQQLPPLSTPLEASDDENSDTVKALQRQIEDMQKSLNDFKKGGGGGGGAAPSRATGAATGSGGGRGGKRGSTGGQVGRPRRKSYDEDDENYQVPEITFDMKKELAGKIQQLEGDQLDKAIKIIYETLDLDNNSDEIELDIDVLPTKTLQKLYMFVVKPQKQKRGPYNKQHVDVDLQPRPPKRAGTGGVKRKSMNEDEEALKIQALEAKLRSFEGVSTEGADTSGVGALPENDEASSGSDSDSVSDSGSESD